MEPIIRVVRKEDQKPALWSGGSTTQLCIYPENAQYSQRDFSWRLSTAVIDSEESEFTKLPGFMRHLMILEGAVRVKHQDHHSSDLIPFQKDYFDGQWTTKSFGSGTDFNLMISENWLGEIYAIQNEGGNKEGFKIGSPSSEAGKPCFCGIYCYRGNLRLMFSEKEVILGDKDFVLLEGDGEFAFEWDAKESCVLILARVFQRST